MPFSLSTRFWCLYLVPLGMVLMPFTAHAQDGIASRIIGKWTLVSVYEENASGDDLDRWGSAAEGQLIAQANGSFSLLIVGRNVIRLATTNAERACAGLRACRETMDRRVLGYAGTLSIAEHDKLLLYVADALERGWIGARTSADVRLEADTMHFVAASESSPTGSFYAHLVWRKAP